MSATAKVETTTIKTTAGGKGFLYITVTNTGTVPLKVASITKAIGSGTGFTITAGEPAKDPFFGVDNDFDEPIQPGETGNIFATVTTPDPMPDKTNIKIAIGIQALEPTCAKNDPDNLEVLFINGEFTAEEIPAATSCTLSPNSLSGEVEKELSYKITCKDKTGIVVTCPEQKFLDFKVSPASTASFISYAANNVKFKVISTGTSTVTVSTKSSYPNNDFSCSAQILGVAGEKDPVPTSCTLSPNSLSGKIGEILNYQMSCTNKDGEVVACYEKNSLDFVFSNPNIASFSSYATDSAEVLVKGAGETQFTVKTKAGLPSSYSCNAKVVGLEDADQINSCTITKPSKIDEDKKFSVSLTCFDKTKVISCNNVEWALSGFAANEAVLHSSDNHAASITLTEKDASGSIVASVDNKKFHCVEGLAVTGAITKPKITSCTLTPGKLTGKIGDTVFYDIICKDSLGTIVECDDETLVEFKSSDENVGVFSSYTKKQVNVFVKNAGTAQFTVSSKVNNPNKYSCSADFVGISPQQANSCVLTKPSTIDLNKQFSVGVTRVA
ncbi:hypothetical protein HYT84_02955 [Candidatus Micrarchaeota archaeon]|nr:hypothetical protein [Candidatus Micrarchaeota archaeon]